MQSSCDIVILAGGASSRLGKPKQTLVFNQTTLLQHSIEIAMASAANRVTVVLGANAMLVQPGIIHDKLAYITNAFWQEGMASSIHCGLNWLLDQAEPPENVLFMVCDQPHTSAGLLDELIKVQKEKAHAIVASKYGDSIGIPAIFARSIFADLLALKGDVGAKKLILQQKDIATVSFPLGDIDIDTAADYERLLKNNC